MAAFLTDEPPVGHNLHGTELIIDDAIGTAKFFFVIRHLSRVRTDHCSDRPQHKHPQRIPSLLLVFLWLRPLLLCGRFPAAAPFPFVTVAAASFFTTSNGTCSK
jgi:hypothetical protein